MRRDESSQWANEEVRKEENDHRSTYYFRYYSIRTVFDLQCENVALLVSPSDPLAPLLIFRSDELVLIVLNDRFYFDSCKIKYKNVFFWFSSKKQINRFDLCTIQYGVLSIQENAMFKFARFFNYWKHHPDVKVTGVQRGLSKAFCSHRLRDHELETINNRMGPIFSFNTRSFILCLIACLLHSLRNEERCLPYLVRFWYCKRNGTEFFRKMIVYADFSSKPTFLQEEGTVWESNLLSFAPPTSPMPNQCEIDCRVPPPEGRPLLLPRLRLIFGSREKVW